MSDKPQYPREQAIEVARGLCELLKPVTARLVVAGSLRRNKATVGDVELLFVPAFADRQFDMFTTVPFDLASEAIGNLLNNGTLTKRPNKEGHFTWGEKNKLAVHRSGVPVDLFSTTEENWWVSLVIRTGGKATNLKLTTGAQSRGMRLNAYGSGFTLQNQQSLVCTSEREVFEIAGVPYAEPEDRE